jgi:hypothetical protein
MTLPTADRTHLGRRNALSTGAELEVRIHLPPPGSLQTLGPSRKKSGDRIPALAGGRRESLGTSPPWALMELAINLNRQSTASDRSPVIPHQG